MSLFTSSRPATRRAETVIQYLRDLLALPEHGPGFKLAPERELATQLNVSRRVIREALDQLQQEGIIERIPGRGTIVVDNKDNNDLAIALQISPQELMTARHALEPAIAATAATHASTHDIHVLRQCYEQSHNARSYAEWEQGDSRFHEALATATHNRLLQHFSTLLSSARLHTQWGRLRKASVDRATRMHYSQQHLKILEAVVQRDPSQAANAMRTHLNTVRRGIEEKQS